MLRRPHVNAVLALLIALAPWLPARAQQASYRQVAVIGYVGPITNALEPSARFAKGQINAIQMAIDAANQQKPRIGGAEVSFQLLPLDDRSDLRTAPLMAEYLVKRRVVGVIGHGNTSTSIAASAIYHQAGIPQLAASASGRAYTRQGFNTTFRVLGHTDRGGELLGAYVARAGLKRFVVIDNEDTSGQAFAEHFVRAARTHGVEIISRASVSDKTSDFNDILNLARSQGADAIFWGGRAKQAMVLAQGIRRLGLNMPLVTGINGVATANFIDQSGAANNVISLESGQPVDRMKGWKAFQHSYEQQFGPYIDRYAPLAYDAAQTLIAAVKAADSLDPAKITRALHGIQLNGLTGPIAFNGEGDLINPLYSVYRLRNRRWELQETLDGK